MIRLRLEACCGLRAHYSDRPEGGADCPGLVQIILASLVFLYFFSVFAFFSIRHSALLLSLSMAGSLHLSMQSVSV